MVPLDQDAVLTQVRLDIEPHPFQERSSVWNGLKVSDITESIQKIEEESKLFSPRESCRMISYLMVLMIGGLAGGIIVGIPLGAPGLSGAIGGGGGMVSAMAYPTYLRFCANPKDPLRLEQREIVREYRMLQSNNQEYLPKDFFQRYFFHMEDQDVQAASFSFEQLQWIHEKHSVDGWTDFFHRYKAREPKLAMVFQLWLKLPTTSVEEMKSILTQGTFEAAFQDRCFLESYLKTLSVAHVGSEAVLQLLLQKLPLEWNRLPPLWTDEQQMRALRTFIEKIQEESTLEEAYEKTDAQLRREDEGDALLEKDLTIRIGEQSFEVNRQRLLSESNYFARLLKGGFKETQGHVIQLQEAAPENISLVLSYVEKPKHFPFDAYDLIDLAKLADYYDMPGMKRAVEEFLVREMEQTFPHKIFDAMTAKGEIEKAMDPLFDHFLWCHQYHLPHYRKQLIEWLSSMFHQKCSETFDTPAFFAERCLKAATAYSKDITSAISQALRPRLVDRLKLEELPFAWETYAKQPGTLCYQACVQRAAKNLFETAMVFDNIIPYDLLIAIG